MTTSPVPPSSFASRVRQWLALLTGVAILAVASPVDGVAARSPGDECRSEDLELDGRGGADRPVLAVHGWTGRGSMWAEEISVSANADIDPPGVSFIDLLDRLDESVDVWHLEYHATSARWIDDPAGGAGHLVAAAVDCLHDAYGVSVIVVSHSMGGLAARWAAARDGRDARIAAAITFGTPHTGSDVAAVAAYLLGVSGSRRPEVPVHPVLVQAIRTCGRLVSVQLDACGPYLHAVTAFDSDAGRALRTGSPQLEAVPDWPDSFPTLSVAGRIEVEAQRSVFGLFYADIARAEIGDGVVSVGSGTAMGSERETTTCTHRPRAGYAVSESLQRILQTHHEIGNVRTGAAGWALLSSPCFHGSLHRTTETTNYALWFLHDHLAGLTVADVVSASFPAMCDLPAARWADGSHPGSSEELGVGLVQWDEETGEGVAFGDVDGDGRTDAAVAAYCTYGGNHYETNVYVFDADGELVGRVPLEEALPTDRPIRGLGDVRISSAGAVRARVYGHREEDATCCPSIVASPSFVWTDGRFEQRGPHPFEGPIHGGGIGRAILPATVDQFVERTGLTSTLGSMSGFLPEEDECGWLSFDSVPDTWGLTRGRDVLALFTNDPGLRTDEGVGVGSSEAEVVAAHPDASRVPNEYVPTDDIVVRDGEQVIRFQFLTPDAASTVSSGDPVWAMAIEGCA